MVNFDRIMVINTGWSDDYQSSEVVGGFGYLATGVGHEKYNFLPDRNGRFYGYVPPLGEYKSPPMPKNPEGWLVFVVSRRPNHKGLFFVGWYENATFMSEYRARPDADELGRDSEGNRFLYTLVADAGKIVPLSLRDRRVSNDHVKRSYAYLRGNDQDEPWRESLANELLALRREFLERMSDGSDDEKDLPPQFNSDPERRRAIEKKAEKEVEAYFKDWICVNRADEKCGYDLLFIHKITREELHIEVKGTARDVPHFFMTHKEYMYAEKLSDNDKNFKKAKGNPPPRWRLAVVHDVENRPNLNIYTFTEMQAKFDIAPYAHHATIKVA